ncbi:MAG: D-alanine--D-alanine ligase [Lachnospiraceae bacterium]|jgi:D-alanine-D-alanine ligase|nr:D-alanine--D-alanine ligase [Lachnospiraceae bacterium]
MNIVVLAGGISTERDVSLVSGKMVYQALRAGGHRVVLLDVYLGLDRDVADPLAVFGENVDWAAGIADIKASAPDLEAVKKLRGGGAKGFFGPHVLAICQAADVVFIALHGESGENGKIQACFDLLGIKYTGSGPLGSALAMDKTLSTQLFAANGIPTPRGVSLERGEAAKIPAIAFPCIVKANSGGSSIGVTIARNEAEYAEALADAWRYDEIALVEEFIEGREFSVGVLAGAALPIVEIAPKQGFFDYANKYQAGAVVETCPAVLSPEKTGEMQKLAERVFQILRLKNYARIDFMMDKDENLYCLEANTLPGMTPASLLPQEAKAAGIEYAALCEKIVSL